MMDTIEFEDRLPESYQVFQYAGPEGFVAFDENRIVVVESDGDGFSFEEVRREHVECVRIEDSTPEGPHDEEPSAERADEGDAVRMKRFMQGTAVEAVLDAEPGDVIEQFA